MIAYDCNGMPFAEGDFMEIVNPVSSYTASKNGKKYKLPDNAVPRYFNCGEILDHPTWRCVNCGNSISAIFRSDENHYWGICPCRVQKVQPLKEEVPDEQLSELR